MKFAVKILTSAILPSAIAHLEKRLPKSRLIEIEGREALATVKRMIFVDETCADSWRRIGGSLGHFSPDEVNLNQDLLA